MTTTENNGRAAADDIRTLLKLMGSDFPLTEWSRRLGMPIDDLAAIGLELGVRFADPPDDAAPMQGRGKERERPEKARARIQAACPGWEAVYESLTWSYVAKSPNYQFDGVMVAGADADEVIARIRRLGHA